MFGTEYVAALVLPSIARSATAYVNNAIAVANNRPATGDIGLMHQALGRRPGLEPFSEMGAERAQRRRHHTTRVWASNATSASRAARSRPTVATASDASPWRNRTVASCASS